MDILNLHIFLKLLMKGLMKMSMTIQYILQKREWVHATLISTKLNNLFTFTELRVVFMEHLQLMWHASRKLTLTLPARGHLVPSPILGLSGAPIVETEFLELVMSLLVFTPRIPLGTFSILLKMACTAGLQCLYSLLNCFYRNTVPIFI